MKENVSSSKEDPINIKNDLSNEVCTCLNINFIIKQW